MSLSGIKALWASEITFGKIDFIQLARTLDIIRDTTLLRLMGWNSVINSGSFFLGMSTICVKFIFFNDLSECRIDSTARVTSGPIICQYF